uniref:Uncharacterized protein n=1 Tax=Arundo donax TaxID=35708 RepID=A0A0A9SM59_ARUDO
MRISNHFTSTDLTASCSRVTIYLVSCLFITAKH